MKHVIFVMIVVLGSLVGNAQQSIPNSFFGLKFDEVYTIEQMIDSVGDKGTFIQETEPFQMGEGMYYGYVFEKVSYDAQYFPTMMLMSLEHGTFGGVAFTFTNENINEGQTLNGIYDSLKTILMDKYGKLSEFPIEGQVGLSRLLNINNGVGLRLDKYTDNDTITAIEVSYISLMAILIDSYVAAYPVIQDTFFGLTMGSIQTTGTIKSAVGYRGEYLKEEYNLYGKTVIFTDLIFAGNTWDYGNFSLTEDGELYGVTAYNSLEDGYGYEDERKAAEQTYDLYKANLDAKYGSHEEQQSGNGRSVVYIGRNDMAIILSNKRNESAGGEYRRYVSIEYYQSEIFGSLSDVGFDEL